MARAKVCEEATLIGDITISSGCVIHPSASIIAESGPIILGENCIVEEYATILYRIPKDYPTQLLDTLKLQSSHEQQQQQQLSNKPALIIGANNVFEVGCTIEALNIGDKNVFECKSYVSPYVVITNGCIIGSGCKLEGKQILPENTVIYSENCLQREALEKQGSHTIQLDYLRKVLPNYHHLKKPNFDPKKVRGQI